MESGTIWHQISLRRAWQMMYYSFFGLEMVLRTFLVLQLINFLWSRYNSNIRHLCVHTAHRLSYSLCKHWMQFWNQIRRLPVSMERENWEEKPLGQILCLWIQACLQKPLWVRDHYLRHLKHHPTNHQTYHLLSNYIVRLLLNLRLCQRHPRKHLFLMLLSSQRNLINGIHWLHEKRHEAGWDILYQVHFRVWRDGAYWEKKILHEKLFLIL